MHLKFDFQFDELPERIAALRAEWDVLDDVARRLTDHKSIVFSELVNQAPETSIERAKHWARTHDKNRDIIDRARVARTAANLKLSEYKSLNQQWETMRSLNASERAEMTMR